jgi:hypothetical protein
MKMERIKQKFTNDTVKAKLDIVDIEANAKIIEASFASIDNTIESTGQTLCNLIVTLERMKGRRYEN